MSRNSITHTLIIVILILVLLRVAPGIVPSTAQGNPTATTDPAQAAAPLSARDLASIAHNDQWTVRGRGFDGVTMVLVPPGCFLMGSTAAQIAYLIQHEDYGDIFSVEGPQTQICFDKPFWIDKTEVTQGNFKVQGGKAATPSYFTDDLRPVEQITWFEASAFCELRGIRLPTEAEWEYAARGPDDLIYPWGNKFDGDKVVYAENSHPWTPWTQKVGSKPGDKSWVGALDMGGNVDEWVSSLYQPYPYRVEDGRESKADTKNDRVARGGRWNVGAILLRAAFRNSVLPIAKGTALGFRCARSY